jgi:hypothetical protein
VDDRSLSKLFKYVLIAWIAMSVMFSLGMGVMHGKEKILISFLSCMAVPLGAYIYAHVSDALWSDDTSAADDLRREDQVEGIMGWAASQIAAIITLVFIFGYIIFSVLVTR